MPQHLERTVYKSRNYAVFKGEKTAETVAFLYRKKTSLINVIGSTRTGEIPRPTVNNGRVFALPEQSDANGYEQAKRFGGDRRRNTVSR